VRGDEPNSSRNKRNLIIVFHITALMKGRMVFWWEFLIIPWEENEVVKISYVK
jgi:hypothetical protein